MVKKISAVLLVCLSFIACATLAYAEVTFDGGFDLRLRQEIWDNVVDLGTLGNLVTSNASGFNDRDFFRFRTRLWGEMDVNKDFSAYLRIANEWKYYLGPYELNSQNLQEDELVVDNLYFKSDKIYGSPFSLKVGRQDFLGADMYGEGFLLMDGTPGDGSRTFYFNAARLRANISQYTDNNTVDFVFIDDPRTDTFFPSWHTAVGPSTFYVDNKQILTASHEQALMVYSRNKFADTLNLEPYYIYKKENPVGTTPGDHLSTFGARGTASLGGWNFGGEFAHQFGDFNNGQPRQGNGGYAFFGRNYDDLTFKPGFEFRYVYLSGNENAKNPDKNATDTTWDPLFSRNPYWNELFIYTLIPETSKYNSLAVPGYWSNLKLLMVKFKFDFTPKTNLVMTYQHLWAAEPTNITGPFAPMFSNSGTDRGHLPTAILSQKIAKNLDGFLQLEYFVPGNFYADTARNATFFRWQLRYTF